MNFYLLKSTRDRDYCGDIILDIDQVESLIAKHVTKDDEDYYIVQIAMKSEDIWKSFFNTLEETRAAMRDLLPNVPLDIINEFKFQVQNPVKKDSSEGLAQSLKKLADLINN